MRGCDNMTNLHWQTSSNFLNVDAMHVLVTSIGWRDQRPCHYVIHHLAHLARTILANHGTRRSESRVSFVNDHTVTCSLSHDDVLILWPVSQSETAFFRAHIASFLTPPFLPAIQGVLADISCFVPQTWGMVYETPFFPHLHMPIYGVKSNGHKRLFGYWGVHARAPIVPVVWALKYYPTQTFSQKACLACLELVFVSSFLR